MKTSYTDDYMWIRIVFGEDCMSDKEYRKWLRSFLKFLIRRDIYQNYVHNVTRMENNYWRANHFPIESPRSFIDDAFLWEASPEGHKFWEDICNDWMQLWENDIRF